MASDLLLASSRLLLRAISYDDEAVGEVWGDLVELVQLYAQACGAQGALLVVEGGRLVDAAHPGMAGTPVGRGLSGAAVAEGEQIGRLSGSWHRGRVAAC